MQKHGETCLHGGWRETHGHISSLRAHTGPRLLSLSCVHVCGVCLCLALVAALSRSGLPISCSLALGDGLGVLVGLLLLELLEELNRLSDGLDHQTLTLSLAGADTERERERKVSVCMLHHVRKKPSQPASNQAAG